MIATHSIAYWWRVQTKTVKNIPQTLASSQSLSMSSNEINELFICVMYFGEIKAPFNLDKENGKVRC